jgi:regulator of protease activity HflC (stomatin/prohibitin superfamily)
VFVEDIPHMDFLSALIGLIETIYEHITTVTVVRDWEGAIRLRFGRFKGIVKPGLAWKIPLVDEIHTCSIAVETIPTKSQSLMTADGISIFVSGAVKCNVVDPEKYIIRVKDVDNAISDLAQGAIKAEITKNTFAQCSETDIDNEISKKLRYKAKDWGVHVESVIITTFDKGKTIRLIQT